MLNSRGFVGLCVALAVGASLGCQKAKQTKVAEPPCVLEKSTDFYLDSSIQGSECKQINATLAALNRWEMNEFSSSAWSALSDAYSTLFGSPSATPMVYIRERVKLIFGSSLLQSDDPEENASNQNTAAANYGFAIWIGSLIENPYEIPTLRLDDGRTVRLGSPRSGMIIIGPALSRVGTLRAAETLVHEARHSDCPGGVSAKQVQALKNGKDLKETLGKCGFTHIKCGPGHPLKGQYACEVPDGWGAYAVGAVYARGLYEACANCTETEKQLALATYVESTGRITDFYGLVTGKYGMPDMSHSEYRSE